MGLLALGHVESSWAWNRIHVPCNGRRILSHWTTREVRALVFILSEMRRLWKGLRQRRTGSELQFSQDFSDCPVEHGLGGARQGWSRGREVAVGIIQGR